jgi:hypothetical protein
MTRNFSFGGRSHRACLGRACIITALSLGAAALVCRTASAAEPGFLKGTWVLEAAYEIQPDGKLAYPYGMKPKGILMVDEEGRYVVEIYGEVRPKFPSPTPTPQQYQGAFLSMSVHTGTAEADEAHHLLTFHVTHNANPDRDMTVQQRPYVFKDGLLTYRVPAAAEGKVNTPVSVWSRAITHATREERPTSADRRAPDL